jgi:O-antigen/teichoic acid export membrane protein
MINKLRGAISKHGREGLLTGGGLLFISMTVVNGGNYLFNLVLGRWLGPAAFADLSLIVTLLLMVRFITAAFQLTSAKFAAAHSVDEEWSRLAALRRWLGKQAWLWGGLMALIIAGGAPFWQQFFHTQSAWPFVILGIGLPIYLVQGVDRGLLQGQTHFKRLAASYQAEMWVRLLAAVALVAIGLAVNGAVLAITLSFIATWFVARKVGDWTSKPGNLEKNGQKMVMAFAGPVVLVYLGQILISNSDIILVKRFFEPELAGQYAAVALIGRIVFFATWSVVTALFPIVARKHQKGEPHRHLLGLSLGIVSVISIAIIAFTVIVPEWIIDTLFGEAYVVMAPLLWIYALATGLYALANVVVNYRLSAGNTKGTWFALGAGLAQVTGIVLFHESLQQVIVVQVVLMACLLTTLLIWDLRLAQRRNYLKPAVELSPNS